LDRLRPFASQVQARNVWLLRADWNDRFMSIMHNTPDGLWDVRDATSGGFNELTQIDVGDDTFCTADRYEAAKAREHGGEFPTIARIGVAVALSEDGDFGTVYVRWNGRVWREGAISRRQPDVYFRAVKAAALRLDGLGVTDLVARVDGTGGFGGDVVNLLLADVDLRNTFDFFEVEEVHFQAEPHDIKAFTDLITEMYYHAAEALRTLALDDPPEALEADLCERPFSWVKSRGYDVKKLRPKSEFKKKVGRSPDDGDGLALCVAPDYLFEPREQELVRAVYDPVRIGGWRRR
jgi:hypothetical protein